MLSDFGSWLDDEYFLLREIYLPVVARDIEFWVEVEDLCCPIPSDAQFDAIEHSVGLAAEPWAAAGEFLYQTYLEALDSLVDAESFMPALPDPKSIWEHIEFGSVWIPYHFELPDRYFVISCKCAWEDEHGFEILFRNGWPERLEQGPEITLSSDWREDYLKMTQQEIDRRIGIIPKPPQMKPEPPPAPVQFELF